ncbi:SRPBCC family protein [Vibrio parahaemolyticus]|uniref:SRPBCC family protein n=1 Tax=Vibrio parahaemolyticus TaxID=670 RepID=UPI001EEA1153|nr:SRPBCC family protein [Vibrio parahaemolyticus]MCG6490166.1 SRPBCC family protein [Vibrio parahaemolyticus]
MVQKIILSDILDFSVEDVWDKISAFDEFADFHPAALRSFYLHQTPERIGSVRRVQMSNGFVEEKLVGFDPVNYHLEYIITQSSLPLSDYRAEIKLTPIEMNTKTEIQWKSTFTAECKEPEKVTADIRENVFVLGLKGLAHYLTVSKY